MNGLASNRAVRGHPLGTTMMRARQPRAHRRASLGCTHWRMAAAGVILAALWTGAVCAQTTSQDLGKLSLSDLAKIVVTSVARSPEKLGTAPASIYVITHAEIMRSGAQTLPEILRLAPNLGVYRESPSQYIITARGFNGNDAAQNFSNKLLVMIDGRSVYSPIFSGMYWDAQYVVPQDIERIEVISGPGGALWGANAVNGVINIITRDAGDTQGGLVVLGAGTDLDNAVVQYGGKLGNDAHYRVYARDFRQPSFDAGDGSDAHNGWRNPQVGFRVDWDLGDDQVTVQGDAHHGRMDQAGGASSGIAEEDLQGIWQRAFDDGSQLRLRTYIDHVRRWANLSGGGFSLKTFDTELQYAFSLGTMQRITWGLGDRLYRYDITPRIGVANSLLWDPNEATQNLASAFAQDQVALARRVQLTLGLKAEHDPYSGTSWMPNVRLAWTPTDRTLWWAAVSRSVRTPTPFDEDVVEKSGNLVFLTGNPDFRNERVTAWETGWRTRWSDRARLSVSLYYNVYDDLKTVEFTPEVLLPLLWGNGMQGHTKGVEAWGSYAVTDRWRLSAGATFEHEDLRFKPGASGLLGVAQAGDDPDVHGFVRSMSQFGHGWAFSVELRGADALPDPHVPGYIELDAHLNWQVNPRLVLSLSGFNLLDAWHVEYPGGDRIPRTAYLQMQVSY